MNLFKRSREKQSCLTGTERAGLALHTAGRAPGRCGMALVVCASLVFGVTGCLVGCRQMPVDENSSAAASVAASTTAEGAASAVDPLALSPLAAQQLWFGTEPLGEDFVAQMELDVAAMHVPDRRRGEYSRYFINDTNAIPEGQATLVMLSEIEDTNITLYGYCGQGTLAGVVLDSGETQTISVFPYLYCAPPGGTGAPALYLTRDQGTLYMVAYTVHGTGVHVSELTRFDLGGSTVVDTHLSNNEVLTKLYEDLQCSYHEASRQIWLTGRATGVLLAQYSWRGEEPPARFDCSTSLWYEVENDTVRLCCEPLFSDAAGSFSTSYGPVTTAEIVWQYDSNGQVSGWTLANLAYRPENSIGYSDAETAQADENIVPAAFAIRDNGFYTDPALLPHGLALADMEAQWREYLDGEGLQIAEAVKKAEREGKAEPVLQWAVDADFDADGKDETYACYGLSTEANIALFYAGTTLYYFDGDTSAGLQLCRNAMDLSAQVLSFAQGGAHLLLCDASEGNHSNGVVQAAYATGWPQVLLTQLDGNFAQHGNTLYTTPRYSFGDALTVHSWQWDTAKKQYVMLQWSEVDLANTPVPEGIVERREEKVLLSTQGARAAEGPAPFILQTLLTINEYYYMACYHTERACSQPDMVQLYRIEESGAAEPVSAFYMASAKQIKQDVTAATQNKS